MLQLVPALRNSPHDLRRKAGYMIGSSPKNLTIMQLLATPIGAAAVSWTYPLLRETYGIVGEHAGLTSPISRKWAGFAEILSRGLRALPPGAVAALGIFRDPRYHFRNHGEQGIGVGSIAYWNRGSACWSRLQ